ncbi:response regulator transcription factor [Granulicella sibirica]|uniref:Sensor histidine kinase n=1 Tax=Granulicella sibirica TaxID=2479048 RepID=A0A4Q0T8B4_9BACT|nr:response regulator transcription factor [Granulicella sibirica]RXH57851.1 sensor histidine kinase [Granulicella sibirica]
MTSRRILVVDDEPQIARVLRASLESSGYEVAIASDGEQAIERFHTFEPQLVITDLAMPFMDGLALTRAIRKLGDIPIIVLSVRNSEPMKIQALDEGADDYITKPFGIQELLARVRSRLRRPTTDLGARQISSGDFFIDIDRHHVTFRGRDLHLTPKEFDLLVFFARHPGRVLTHKILLHAIWGSPGDGNPEYLRVLIAQLRKKIEAAPEVANQKLEPRYVRNEPWIGYRFTPDGNPDGDPDPTALTHS